MTRSPILISGCAAPHVPTRRKVCTPSSLSSSTAIATDGPPMPVDIVDTFTPPSAPVKVRYSRLNATSRALSRYSAIFGVRNGSPGTSTYSPTSPGPRPTWYFFCSVFIVRPARARRQPPKRSLSAARDAVLVHAREYVGRLTNLALGQSPGTAESGRHPVDKLLRARVNGDERVTAPHPSSDGSLDDEARRGIDLVFLAHAARAQLERGEAYLERIDRLDVSVGVSLDRDLHRRDRKALPEVTALRGEHALEDLASGPRAQDLLHVGRDVGQRAHLPSYPQAHLEQLLVPFAGERIERLLDLEGVADRSSERVVHRGHEGHRPPLRAFAERDHLRRELLRGRHVRHERAASELHVQDDGVRAGGDLLRHHA